MNKQQTNECFRKVVKKLEEKGILVRKHSKKLQEGEFNVTKFTEALGSHSGIIPAIMKGVPSRNVSDNMIDNLCSKFGISERYMRLGEGPMFAGERKRSEPSSQQGNILMSSIVANAGDTLCDDGWEEENYFGIPGLEGELTAFRVKGDSMEPILMTGDLVICIKLERLTEIKKGEIYAVCTEGTVRIKYVEPLFNEHGQATNLKLISENAEEHFPIFVELNRPVSLYKLSHVLQTIESARAPSRKMQKQNASF